MKTKKPLEKVTTIIDANDYSLKEYAEYLERNYNGKYLTIVTKSETIKIKLDNEVFPHLIGMQYCYSKQRNKHKYKGADGFIKLKSGEITLEMLRNNYRKNNESQLSWEDRILPRIEWLPCFLNSISKKEYHLCENDKTSDDSILNGDYLLFKFGRDKYAILSIIKVGKTYSCESFFYNSGLNYYNPSKEIDIIDMYLL